MNRQISPLRYPGGKARIAEFLEDLMMLNDLSYCKLYELYAGGAGASLSLLANGLVEEVVLNDLDPHIYAFWKSVIDDTENLVQLISDTVINMQNWEKQKRIYTNHQEYDFLEVGFSTFFLNRTNRSGVLNAGPIGGKKQDGNYKMDVRYNKPRLIERIERIANLKKKITLYNEESITLLERFFKEKKENSLFFLDPPYYLQGENLYYNFYKDSNHIDLAELLKRHSDENWFLTYDNCQQITALYQSFSKGYLPMTYTLQQKIKTKEIMVFSNSLFVPKNLRMGRNSARLTRISN